MTKKSGEAKVLVLEGEQNSKTLTYRCIEAVLLKQGILDRNDSKQIQNFRKNAVPDLSELLNAIEQMYQAQNYDSLVNFYISYGVDVSKYH
jgi:hypothetical protein